MQDSEQRRPAQSPGEMIGLISWPVRLLLAFGGVTLFSVAAYSVVKTTNELGSFGLTVVGCVLVVLAALGRFPNRVSWGDKSAEWVVQDLAKRGSPETKVDLARSLGRLEQIGRFQLEDVLTMSRQSDSEHSKKLHAIGRIVPGGVRFSAPASGLGRMVDAELRRAEDDSSPIAVLTVPNDSPPPMIEASITATIANGYQSVVLVVEDAATRRAELAIPEDLRDRVFLANINSPNSARESIRDAVQAESSWTDPI